MTLKCKMLKGRPPLFLVFLQQQEINPPEFHQLFSAFLFYRIRSLFLMGSVEGTSCEVQHALIKTPEWNALPCPVFVLLHPPTSISPSLSPLKVSGQNTGFLHSYHFWAYFHFKRCSVKKMASLLAEKTH